MKLGGCTTSACLRGEQRVVHSPVSSIPRKQAHVDASSAASENVTFGPRATRHLLCILCTGRQRSEMRSPAFWGGDYLIVSPSAQRPRIPPRGRCRGMTGSFASKEVEVLPELWPLKFSS
jgi:hypothetical protein